MTGAGSRLYNKIAVHDYHELLASDLDGGIFWVGSINTTSFDGAGEVGIRVDEAAARTTALDLDDGPLPVILKFVSVEVEATAMIAAESSELAGEGSNLQPPDPKLGTSVRCAFTHLTC